MTGPDRDLPEVYLQPGEYFLAREPTLIWTILGSCVSVSFWSVKLGAGALCHSMLPRHPGPASPDLGEGHRYMDYAIRDIALQFDKLGAKRSEVQVKLFGGADVLYPSASSRPTVGRLNQEAAIEVLRDEGFEVMASSLGGKSGLKIFFDTATGEVLLRRLT
jgi:chemotaxis protein CheD